MSWFKRRKAEPYTCRVCGRSHEGQPTDYGYLLPDVVWNEPPEVRQAHLDWATDVCSYQGRWFLRGVLEISFRFEPGRFGWGAWIEVSEETIARFREHYGEKADHSAREPGMLANRLPVYADTLGLPAEVQFGPLHLRPLLFLPESVEHLLATDQREGIDEARYHEILGAITSGRPPTS